MILVQFHAFISKANVHAIVLKPLTAKKKKSQMKYTKNTYTINHTYPTSATEDLTCMPVNSSSRPSTYPIPYPFVRIDMQKLTISYTSMHDCRGQLARGLAPLNITDHFAMIQGFSWVLPKCVFRYYITRTRN